MNIFTHKGQVTVGVAVIGGIFTLMSSFVGSWMLASSAAASKLEQVNTDLRVVQERENNHYAEVQRRLDEINVKLDRVLSK